MNDITYFNSFIAQKATGIPYSTQWMVHLERLPDVISSNLKEYDTQTWNINKSGKQILQNVATAAGHVEGNILAQSVTVPGENVAYERGGMESGYKGGFLGAPIINSRSDNTLVTIDFLETRDSFVDLVVRPWIIQVGFKGLIPPANDRDSIKTTLWAVFFDRGDAAKNEPPRVRKKWCFYNAVPVAIDPDTFDFQKNRITIVKTQWLFSHYTISTEENGSLSI